MEFNLHLVTDLDGTWIPAGDALASLRRLEAHLAGSPNLTLTFATGRTLQSALIELSRLVSLWPEHFVSDVGTAIHHRHSTGRWVEDAEYARLVGERWDTETADRLFRELPPGIRPQRGLRPRRRMALEVLPGHDLERAAEDMATCLEKAWFPADVLPSNGRCLDVLPRGVDKGTALDHLERRVDPDSVLVVCGDSENDLGMFRRADLAVLMSDSPMKEEALRLPAWRIFRPQSPGPAGIQQALALFQDLGWPERNPVRPHSTFKIS